MRIKLHFLLFIAIGLSAGLTSCKKDNTAANCTNGTFNATVDGTAFTGATYQNTVIRASQNGVIVKRLDIRATASNGKMIILTVTNLEGAATGKCLKAATYDVDPTMNYTDGTNYEGAIGTYMLNSTTIAGQTTPGSSGSITISSCNETNQQVSGTFTFTTSTMFGGSAHTISGTFTDMCYTFSE